MTRTVVLDQLKLSVLRDILGVPETLDDKEAQELRDLRELVADLQDKLEHTTSQSDMSIRNIQSDRDVLLRRNDFLEKQVVELQQYEKEITDLWEINGKLSEQIRGRNVEVDRLKTQLNTNTPSTSRVRGYLNELKDLRALVQELHQRKDELCDRILELEEKNRNQDDYIRTLPDEKESECKNYKQAIDENAEMRRRIEGLEGLADRQHKRMYEMHKEIDALRVELDEKKAYAENLKLRHDEDFSTLREVYMIVNKMNEEKLK
jgi:chromosome segregation ATPase